MVGTVGAAKLLNQSKQSIHRMIQAGKIKSAKRIAHEWTMDEKEILEIREKKIKNDELACIKNMRKGTKVRMYTNKEQLEYISGEVVIGHKLDPNASVVVKFMDGSIKSVLMKELVILKSRNKLK